MTQCVREEGIELLGQLKRFLFESDNKVAKCVLLFSQVGSLYKLYSVHCVCVSCELIIAGFQDLIRDFDKIRFPATLTYSCCYDTV